MSERKTLYKRPPTLSQNVAAPYSTLNQNPAEKLRLRPGNVSVSSLSPQATTEQSQYTARLVSEGLQSVADQINSSENEARRAQNVAEAAHASDTAEQLARNLADWRVDETKNINQQIQDELSRQGISRSDLQSSPKLRRVVADWKAKIYADLNKNLDTYQQQAISDAQSRLSISQEEVRQQLNANISAYESKLAPEIDVAVATTQQNTAYQKTVDYLKTFGILNVDGDQMSIAKPTEQLTASDIKALNSIGFSVTQEQVTEAQTQRQTMTRVQTLAYAGVVKVIGDQITLQKPLGDLTVDEVRELTAIGFPINQGELMYASMTKNMIDRGVVSQSGDTLTVTKPIDSLSDYEVSQLKMLGFNVSTEQRDTALRITTTQNKVTAAVNDGLITLNGDIMTVNKPIADLSSAEVQRLQDVGFTISQSQVDAAIRARADLLTHQAQLDAVVATSKFTPEQINAQTEIFRQAASPEGYTDPVSGTVYHITAAEYEIALAQQTANWNAEVTQQQRALETLAASGIVTSIPVTFHDPTAPLNKQITNTYTITKNIATISDYDYNLLKEAGFNVTSEMESQRAMTQQLLSAGVIRTTTVEMVGPLQYSNQVRPTYESIVLAKSIVELTPVDVKQLNTLGFNIDSAQIAATKSLLSTNTIKIDGDVVSLVKPITTLTDHELSQLRSIGMQVQALPAGPNMAIFEWGQETFKDNGQLQAGTQFASAVFGQIATDMAVFPRLITKDLDFFNLIPDVDIQFRGPTLQNLGYMVTLTGAQKPFLTAANVALGVGEGIVLGAGIGKAFQLTASGLTKVSASLAANSRVAAALAQLPSFKGAATVANISAYLKAHPKVLSALMVAPLAGQEAYSVIQQIHAGASPEEIAENSLKSIGFTIGTFGGLSLAQRASIGKAVKFEGVSTADGTKLILTVDEKLLPANWEQLIKTRFDPVTGKNVIVGLSSDSIPTSIQTGRVFDNIIVAKQSGSTLAMQNTVRATIGDDGYNTFVKLIGGAKNISTMSPEDILVAVNRTQNIMSFGKVPVASATGLAVPGGIQVSMNTLYSDLLRAGYSKSDALYWTGKLLSSTPDDIVTTARTVWKMSNGQIEYLINASASSGAINDYAYISRLVQKSGLSAKQTEEVFATISKDALSSDLRSFAKSFSKLDSNAMEVAAQLLPEETLVRATKYMEAPDLSRLFANTFAAQHPDIMRSALANIETSTLAKTVNMMTTRDITRLLPSMTEAQATEILSSLKQDVFNATITGLSMLSLTNTKADIQSSRLKELVVSISLIEFAKIAGKFDSSTLKMTAPLLSDKQWIEVFKHTSADAISATLANVDLSTMPIDAILTNLQLTPEEFAEYVKSGKIAGRTLENTNISPNVMKRLLDAKFSYNKKEIGEQKSAKFDVLLMYGGASNDFKVNADSFHGAARNAMARRVSSALPSSVIIRKLDEGKA